MKFFVLLFVCFSLTAGQTELLSSNQLDTLLKYHTECQENTGITLEAIISTYKKDNSEVTPQIKDHFFCVSKKLGVQNEEGTLQVEKIKEYLSAITGDAEKVEVIMKKCTVQGPNPGDTAFGVSKCLFEAATST